MWDTSETLGSGLQPPPTAPLKTPGCSACRSACVTNSRPPGRHPIHCYGDLLARARHPSTPSRPRVCRTRCSQGITRDPCPGSLRRRTCGGLTVPPPVDPTTSESRTVGESADVDLQRDVDPPAGRPMGDPEPELRGETKVAQPHAAGPPARRRGLSPRSPPRRMRRGAWSASCSTPGPPGVGRPAG